MQFQWQWPVSESVFWAHFNVCFGMSCVCDMAKIHGQFCSKEAILNGNENENENAIAIAIAPRTIHCNHIEHKQHVVVVAAAVDVDVHCNLPAANYHLFVELFLKNLKKQSLSYYGPIKLVI